MVLEGLIIIVMDPFNVSSYSFVLIFPLSGYILGIRIPWNGQFPI